ncbi:hypothetical protein LZF95_04230 [Algoriphagus sp. AGSA1]|uniref:hypothetical protein n=1 Tax=Algoriphagus sp. AGSA1 TaxID=2907213 RepID=UPI001F2D1D60|nr:hypothetical protein [Algoriphagus sp. AGSA1]MCE7053875.1 hypothetical protein [Algoriphagus sp. AGSA1]
MKNKTNISDKLWSNFMLIGLLMIALACNEDETFPEAQVYEVAGDNFKFFSNPGKYQEINNRRATSEYCTFDWSIEKINRSGNTLKVEVDVPENCEIDYELIWNGSLFFVDPPVANVFLNLTSTGCQNSESRKTELLTLDLKQAFKNLSDEQLRTINFNIQEVCAIVDLPCNGDCDVTS